MKKIQYATIAKEICVRGVCVFSGRCTNIRLAPADLGNGFRLIRTDVKENNIIKIDKSATYETANLNTTISNGKNEVKMIEHLVSALWLFKITDIDIYVDGDEIPMLDGSAINWVKAICSAGRKTFNTEKSCKFLDKEISVKLDDRYIIAKPCDHLKITYTIDFKEPTIGKNTFTFDETIHSYATEIAPARTFCTATQVETHKKIKKAFTTNDIIVFDDNAFEVAGKQLRYANEATRHKILDIIGDLTSTGDFICGEFICYKSGHLMNRQIIDLLYK